jgi:hypothetical protein
MARSNGRWGRLRRVLNEDLSNSSAVYGTGENDRTPGDTPRYGAGANIENHPQVTDYVPRRYRMMGSILAGGIALGIVGETVAHHANSLNTTFGTNAAELTDILSNRLIGWTSAMALIVAGAFARIIYLLKRHRLDDLRGRYRVWRTGSLLAVVVSACCVTGAHTLLGNMLSHLTGWNNSAAWWLVPSAIVGAWVLGRLILDAAECRTALAMFVIASLSFATAAACSAGWSLVEDPLWSESLSRSLPLAGCLAILAGTLFTARYVVLDVQGLIDHEPVQVKTSVAKTFSRKVEETAAKELAAEDDETSWTDGTEPDHDYGDDDRPLSKAERKRLRKQQGRYRAA